MDELTIDGKTYVSSKRAASISGYAKDYVGQLCREGRVEARLVGRSWYVYEPALRAHRFEDGRKGEEEAEENEGRTIPTILRKDTEQNPKENLAAISSVEEAQTSDIANIQAVWEHPTYTSEEVQEVPIFDEKELGKDILNAQTEDEVRLSEMQSAWQEWFTNRPSGEMEQKREIPGTNTVEEPHIEAEQAHDEEEPAPVPMRRIIADIAPPVAYKDERDTYPREEKTRIAAESTYRKQGNTRSKKGSSLIAKAVLVAFSIAVVSITLIATGTFDSLQVETIDNSFIFKFFEGENKIK